MFDNLRNGFVKFCKYLSLVPQVTRINAPRLCHVLEIVCSMHGSSIVRLKQVANRFRTIDETQSERVNNLSLKLRYGVSVMQTI